MEGPGRPVWLLGSFPHQFMGFLSGSGLSHFRKGASMLGSWEAGKLAPAPL